MRRLATHALDAILLAGLLAVVALAAVETRNHADDARIVADE